MDLAALVHLAVYIIVVACIFGLLLYLVQICPIPEPFKGWFRIGLIAVAVLILIFWLLSLIGGPPLRLH